MQQLIPDVLRVQEFARRLQVSAWTVRRWAYDGKVASCKIGGGLYIPASEVERLIEKGYRPAAE